MTTDYKWFNPVTCQPLKDGEMAYPGYICVTEEGPHVVRDIEQRNGRTSVQIVEICKDTNQKLLNAVN